MTGKRELDNENAATIERAQSLVEKYKHVVRLNRELSKVLSQQNGRTVAGFVEIIAPNVFHDLRSALQEAENIEHGC